MKKYMFWLVCLLILVVSANVLAQEGNSDDPFQVAMTKAVNAFQGTRALVFTIGAFALVGFAGAAIFGKIKWQWVGALAVGLGVLAVAGYIVNFAYSKNTDGVKDTPNFIESYW